MAGDKSLFACTKCHARHPFEELSKEEHLCKTCRRKNPPVACIYCRLEYHIITKVHGEPLCSKCSHYLSLYGKPKNCKYCQIKAAFQKSCCARCLSSEKKYGAPVTCSRCKLKCAFNKSTESQTKVGGQILCLQCTLEYKRIRHKQKLDQKKKDAVTSNWSSKEVTVGALNAENLTTKFKSGIEPMKTQNDRFSGSFKSTILQESSNDASQDVSYGDHMSELTKLKDEIDVLKKKVSLKDKLLIEKDKKINELNAEIWDRDKQLRTKIQSVQKENDEKIKFLQDENRSLKKQISTLSKNPKIRRKDSLQSKIILEPHKLGSPHHVSQALKQENSFTATTPTNQKAETKKLEIKLEDAANDANVAIDFDNAKVKNEHHNEEAIVDIGKKDIGDVKESDQEEKDQTSSVNNTDNEDKPTKESMKAIKRKSKLPTDDDVYSSSGAELDEPKRRKKRKKRQIIEEEDADEGNDEAGDALKIEDDKETNEKTETNKHNVETTEGVSPMFSEDEHVSNVDSPALNSPANFDSPGNFDSPAISGSNPVTPLNSAQVDSNVPSPDPSEPLESKLMIDDGDLFEDDSESE